MSSKILNLLNISDPALPIGGFSHSSGLETYVQLNIVKDVITARQFLTGMLSTSLHYSDAAFVSLAYDAAQGNNFNDILSLDEECTAIKLPEETRLASRRLGIRLIKLFQEFYPSELITSYSSLIGSNQAIGNYCIAFGIFASIMQIEKKDALTGFYYNAASGIITNCVKLIPLGQQDGLKLFFSVKPLILELSEKSMSPERDLIGLSSIGFDIRCMQHEQLYSRLYMS